MSPTESGSARPSRRHTRPKLAAGAFALVTAAAGTAFALAGQHSAGAAALPSNFRSIGYMPSWSGSVDSIQYGKLTHVNCAFVLPNANGSLQAVDNPGKLSSLVSLAHGNNVKVSISIGGWNNGDDSAFEALAGNASARGAFVSNVVNFVNQYNLDGADIDWEYPDPGGSAGNYAALMQQLSGALHGRGKLLTAAVVSEGGTANGVPPAVFGYVDWLNIMAYDGGSPHANYDWAVNSVNFWKSRGLPAGKAVMGVPFYSRPSYLTYASLVAMDPANANRDCTTVNGSQECYNGLPTVKRKTQWAMANAGGVMNWELSQDTNTGTSLVSAIYATATGGGGRTGPVTGIAGKCVDVAAASSANGTAIQLYTCNGTGAQVWQAQGNGTLRNPQANKCLDATGASAADGTRLQIWDCFGGTNQVWRLP